MKYLDRDYFIIVGLCISMCIGLKYVERHVDSLAKVYNANAQKQLKNDFKKKGR